MTQQTSQDPASAGAASPLRVLGAAALTRVLSTLPVWLLGALAVLIRDDLAFGRAQLGVAVSTFFVAAALSSIYAGRLVERLGARSAMNVSSAVSGGMMLCIGAFARDFASLLVLLVVGGVANAVSQSAGNLALSRGIPRHAQGLAFGVKQGAVSVTTLIAGASVPAIGLTVGWRWAYVGAALLLIPYFLLAPSLAGAAFRGTGRRVVRAGDAPLGPLIAIAVAGGCGTAATTAMGAFYVESAVEQGLSAGRAGVWLAIGSASAIVARLYWGWLADRRGGRNLALVITLLLTGSAGMVLLGFVSDAVLLLAVTIVAFGAGWGWNGLYHFAVVRLNPNAPAAATGIVAVGLFAGGIVGPVSFGAIVESASFAWAWIAATALLLLAALFLHLGRSWLRRTREQQTPDDEPIPAVAYDERGPNA